ncbi:MAG TPA: hypothetical protein VGW34_11515 [Allosphingosinicella sp.]|nr:hypothetical protein [Allosphingosinicella sp.]
MLRIVGSVVAGAVTALAVLAIVQTLGHILYPLPEDLDLRDPEAVARAVPAIPLAAKLIVVFAWFAAALAGGAIAKRIRGRWWSPWLIAALVALVGVVTIMIIPYPAWMHIAAVAAPLLGGLAASHLVRGETGVTDANL